MLLITYLILLRRFLQILLQLIFSVILFTAIMRLEQEMTLVYIGMTALNTLKVQ